MHEKGTVKYTQQDSLEESGGKSRHNPICKDRILIVVFKGGNLNAASRQALMQKLARIEPTPKPLPVYALFSTI